MSSFEPLYKQIDSNIRLALAGLFIAILYVLNIAAISIPLGSYVKIPLFLMAVYYWSIYRPTLVPVWLVFSAGLLMDFLGATPIGFNALIFVMVHWLVSAQRKLLMSQSFIVLWFGFALLYVVSLLLKWLIAGSLQIDWFEFYNLMVPAMFGIVFFPPTYIMLHLTHKILPGSLSRMSLKAR